MGGASLISEKQFATSHAALWRELLPMAEEYLLTRNRTLSEFATPIVSVLQANSRGLVNELGFRLYVASINSKTGIDALPDEIVAASVRDTAQYIRTLREPPSKETVSAEEIREAKSVAKNLTLFFLRFARNEVMKFPVRRPAAAEIIASPGFRGCGWLDECVGDLFVSDTLFEVKAGDRKFRSIDLRQVLIYCALNFASKTYDIAYVCLVNPRLGVFLGESLQRLCLEVSGRTAPEVLGEIVDYVSEPLDRYVDG